MIEKIFNSIKKYKIVFDDKENSKLNSLYYGKNKLKIYSVLPYLIFPNYFSYIMKPELLPILFLEFAAYSIMYYKIFNIILEENEWDEDYYYYYDEDDEDCDYELEIP
jgi:hypothetical protein